MNNIKEFIQLAENIVNELGDKIIADEIGLYEGEIVQVMEEMKLELYTQD